MLLERLVLERLTRNLNVEDRRALLLDVAENLSYQSEKAMAELRRSQAEVQTARRHVDNYPHRFVNVAYDLVDAELKQQRSALDLKQIEEALVLVESLIGRH